MSSFDLKQIQTKLKFLKCKSQFLLSEVSHVWSKSSHANNLKTFAKANEKWRHARKCRSWEEEFIQKIGLFQLCCVKKCNTKKELQTTKQKNQEQRNIALLSLQLRSYKNKFDLKN